MKYLLFAILVLAGACDTQTMRVDQRDHEGTRRLPPASPEGLIAHMAFDGSFASEYAGVVRGRNHGATFVPDRFNRRGAAVRFDGSESYVELEGSHLLQIQPPLSYAFWVNVDQDQTTSAVFTSNYQSSNNTGVFAAFDSNGSNPSVSIGNGDVLGVGSRRTFHSRAPLEPGRWYHIVGVVASVDSLRLYVDGIRQSGHVDGGAERLIYGPGPSVFGRRAAAIDQPPIYFSGVLDDFRFYEVALDDEDVMQLYVSE